MTVPNPKPQRLLSIHLGRGREIKRSGSRETETGVEGQQVISLQAEKEVRIGQVHNFQAHVF